MNKAAGKEKKLANEDESGIANSSGAYISLGALHHCGGKAASKAYCCCGCCTGSCYYRQCVQSVQPIDSVVCPAVADGRCLSVFVSSTT